MRCPLCTALESKMHFSDGRRAHYRCEACAFVFVPREYHLLPSDEKRRYDSHQNDVHDAGYRSFLERLVEPIAQRLDPGAHGIDYGSGPTPALSILLKERGFSMINYDPFYADDRAALLELYDFLVSSETVEHFCHPWREWDRMVRIVKHGGLIGVMTEMRDESKDFAAWRYKDDATHVSLYAPRTFTWIAQRFGLELEIIGGSVALFRK